MAVATAVATLSPTLPVPPALIAAVGPKAGVRFVEIFAAQIRNKNTRRAYVRAVTGFFDWCHEHGMDCVIDVEPLQVSAWLEMQTKAGQSAPSVKQRLAALRHLFDWLVVGQIMPLNSANSVRGPKHSVRSGKTSVLEADEARTLLDSIDISTPAGLRDRALIALMAYSFARIGAVIGMRVEDVFTQRRRIWVRLHEKGGKDHDMPCHHNLEEYLMAYLDGCALRDDPKGPLFRTIPGRGGRMTRLPLSQADAYRMVARRAAAGINTKVGNHSFRATGIIAYLKNGGVLEKAASMANHASMRTTQLCDRHHGEMSLDEVERVMI